MFDNDDEPKHQPRPSKGKKGKSNHSKRTPECRSVAFIRHLQGEFIKNDFGYHKSLHRHLVDGVEFARQVHSEKDLRTEFFREDFFKGSRKLKRRNVLRLVMKYLLGAHEGPRYKRSNIYATALNHSFKTNVSSEQLAALLKTEGIEGLYKAELKRRKEVAAGREIPSLIEGASDRRESARSTRSDEKVGSDSVSEKLTSEDRQTTSAAERRKKPSDRYRLPKLGANLHYLHVEVGPELFNEAMDLAAGERIELVVQAPQGHATGDFQRLTAQHSRSASG